VAGQQADEEPVGAGNGLSRTSIGEPLRSRAFRAVWTTQMVSNVGLWMQTVAAQWFLTATGAEPSQVALVQTAATLPFFVLGLPAGVIADLVDRRRLITSIQVCMALVAVLLAAAGFSGRLTATGLLFATFLLAAGQTLAAPAWQALIPELVERRLVPTAALLNATGFNGARAIGPALGGLVVVALGPSWVFLLNGFGFILVAVAAATRVPRGKGSGAEGVRAAIRAGAMYVRFSPLMRRLLLRNMLWTLPASAVWGLLPVVANRQLGLGAGGYGLLLGALGVGAVVGAFVLAPLRHKLSWTYLVGGCSLLYALCMVSTGLSSSPWAVFAVLVVAGGCWMAVMSSFMATAQVGLPLWIRARGIATYLLVFQGGQALGAYLWGEVADVSGVGRAMVISGVVLVLTTSSLLWWPMPAVPTVPPVVRGDDEQHPHPAPDDHDGPLLVTTTYTVRADAVDAFSAAVEELGRLRRQAGARRWSCDAEGAEDVSDPVYVERYLVSSATEHEDMWRRRRPSEQDHVEAEIAALTTRPVSVRVEPEAREGVPR
jgi:MFS family permease